MLYFIMRAVRMARLGALIASEMMKNNRILESLFRGR